MRALPSIAQILAAQGAVTAKCHERTVWQRKFEPCCRSDVVYGVKEPLIVDFVERPPGKAPTGEVLATPVLRDQVRLRAAESGAGARRGGVNGLRAARHRLVGSDRRDQLGQSIRHQAHAF